MAIDFAALFSLAAHHNPHNHHQHQTHINMNIPTVTVLRPMRPARAPWPENNYMILEHGTKRALGAVGDTLCLLSGDWGMPVAAVTWRCVDNGGFFGFQNLLNNKFLSHHGDGRMGFSDPEQRNYMVCDQILPRPHPEGGIQLMVPEHWQNLKPIVVDQPTGRLGIPKECRADGEEGIWDFMKVENYLPADGEEPQAPVLVQPVQVPVLASGPGPAN